MGIATLEERLSRCADRERRLSNILQTLAPSGAQWAVIYPYDDCTIFSKGNIVWYIEQQDEKSKLPKYFFWHPIKKKWLLSSRLMIMEDACSVAF